MLCNTPIFTRYIFLVLGDGMGEFKVCTVCTENTKSGDGPSENERKSETKEITTLIIGGQAKNSFQHERWVRGLY